MLMGLLSAVGLSGALAQGRPAAGQVRQGGGVIQIPTIRLKTTHVEGSTVAAGGLEPKYFEPDNRTKRKIPAIPTGPFIGNPRPSPPTNVQIPSRTGVAADTDNTAGSSLGHFGDLSLDAQPLP